MHTIITKITVTPVITSNYHPEISGCRSKIFRIGHLKNVRNRHDEKKCDFHTGLIMTKGWGELETMKKKVLVGISGWGEGQDGYVFRSCNRRKVHIS